jgi:hypothetical protein
MKNFVLWTLAVIVTLASAVYQRMTGPTYPVRGKVTLAGSEIKYRLPRSAESGRDCEVSIKASDPSVGGSLLFKRHKVDEAWTQAPLERKDGALTASLPKHPPAAKVVYKVILNRDQQEVSLTGDKPIVLRFRGVVPSWILIPHIVVMFLAMLFSTRAGIEALRRSGDPRRLVLWTVALLLIGGFVFGPAVQKLSFGTLWTGIPVGHDLTDSKTLLALAVWVAAAVAGRRGKQARGWVLAAAIVLFAVFLIPHSVLGSELKY